MHILFVCTGNTCRSPMAETACREWLKDPQVQAETAGLDITCGSAGIFAETGTTTHRRALQAMRNAGAPAVNRQAVTATPEMLAEADIIAVMTRSHMDTLLYYYPQLSKDKFRVLNVPDPYGGDQDTYDQCYDKLKAVIRRMLRRLQ